MGLPSPRAKAGAEISEGGLQKALERRKACNSREEGAWHRAAPARPGWRDVGKGKLQRTLGPQGPRSHLRLEVLLRPEFHKARQLELERSWGGGLTGAAPSPEEMSEWGPVLDRGGGD